MKIGVYGGSFNPCHLMHKLHMEGILMGSGMFLVYSMECFL